MKLDKIIDSLENLPKKDLETVVARSRYLIQKMSPKTAMGDGEFFYKCWMEELRVEQYGKTIPFYVYKKHRIFSTFKTNFENLQEFTKDAFGKLTQVEKAFVFRLYAFLLIKYAEKRNLGITPNMLGYQLDKVPSLFHQAYPGYIKAGLAKSLIRSEKDNEKGKKFSVGEG